MNATNGNGGRAPAFKLNKRLAAAVQTYFFNELRAPFVQRDVMRDLGAVLKESDRQGLTLSLGQNGKHVAFLFTRTRQGKRTIVSDELLVDYLTFPHGKATMHSVKVNEKSFVR